MIVGVIMGYCPSQHCIGAWRLSRAFRRYSYSDNEFWADVARVLDRSGVDFLLLADQLGAYSEHAGSHHDAVKYGVQFPIHDPAAIVPVIGRASRSLGIAMTLSTAGVEPYVAARLLSSLDHVTQGRLAWNIVTGYGPGASAALGLQDSRSKSLRYAMADEFIRVCLELWNSWDADAGVARRCDGVFLDPSKIRRVEFDGEFYRCRGVFSVPPSPQRHPVLVQAGASEAGLALAATYADLHFATASSPEGMRHHVGRLRSAVEKKGRTAIPKILWACSVFVAESEEAAQAVERRLIDAVPIDAALSQLSADLGVNLSGVDLRTKVRDIDLTGTGGVEGIALMLADGYSDKALGDLAALYGTGMAGLRFTGTPEKVAAAMERHLASGGGDGFIIRCGELPSSIYDLCDLLLPVLRPRPAPLSDITFRARLGIA